MFGFLRKKDTNKVAQVFEEFEIYLEELGTPGRAESLVSREYVQELLGKADDVHTVLTMLAVLREASFSERFIEKLDYINYCQELIDTARASGVDPQEFVEKEADSLVDSAKELSDKIADLLDDGQIIGSTPVREYMAEHLTTVMTSWIHHRLRAREACDRLLEG